MAKRNRHWRRGELRRAPHRCKQQMRAAMAYVRSNGHPENDTEVGKPIAVHPPWQGQWKGPGGARQARGSNCDHARRGRSAEVCSCRQSGLIRPALGFDCFAVLLRSRLFRRYAPSLRGRALFGRLAAWLAVSVKVECRSYEFTPRQCQKARNRSP